MRIEVADEAAMRSLASEVGAQWQAGNTVLLEGELGAGKTTFVRGYLESLGVKEPVRSPTFNLIQIFETNPPVMHADLYRLQSSAGIGIEEYLDSHVCFIEWPDRATALIDSGECWHIKIEFREKGRLVEVTRPTKT